MVLIHASPVGKKKKKGVKKMKYRSKVPKRKSKKMFRKTSRPLKANRTRPGLKRGGTRL